MVYIVWGSTYLAIRVCVREGGGFPPFTMAAMRVFAAAIILFSWSILARKRIKAERWELAVLCGSGVLLWLGGNGMVAWAEQRAESGYSALLIGALPLWVAVMESIIDRRLPTLRFLGALLIGLAGVAVLNGKVILEGAPEDLYSALALVAAAVLWGMGTILQKRKAVSLKPEVSSAYQHMFGGIALLLAAVIMAEPRPTPIPQAWMAWGYLVVFGSLFAFTSFVKDWTVISASFRASAASPSAA